MLLRLEPIGQEIQLLPGEVYDLVTTNGGSGPLEVIFEADSVAVYGWNGSDSVVFHAGQQVAGLLAGTDDQGTPLL